MKRIITFVVCAVALVLSTASCSKDDYGTYEFFTNTNIAVIDAGRAQQIRDIIVADSYFTSTHKYTAKYSSAVNLAVDEFKSHIDGLDVTSIEANLEFGESVRISLWSMDPGQKWLTYIITPSFPNIMTEDD